MNHRLSITVKIYTQNTDFTVFTRIPDADKIIKKSVGESKDPKIKIFFNNINLFQASGIL